MDENQVAIPAPANLAASLDALDLAILAQLKQDGRMSNLQLSEVIPLSHSAISRRIKRMEESGVIEGYGARINPAAIGQNVRAFAAVQRQPMVSAIELAKAFEAIPEVVSCWIVTGEADVFIEVAARDMSHFSAIMLDYVQFVPGVAATKSMFILNPLKER